VSRSDPQRELLDVESVAGHLLPEKAKGSDAGSERVREHGSRRTLRDGASFTDMGLVTSTESLARIYGRRLRLTRRKGTATLGLERAVQLLADHALPIRLGKLTAADGSWVFILFLTPDGRSLVACTGVRQSDKPPL